MGIFEGLMFLIFCMALGRCCGITFAYGVQEEKTFDVVAGIVGIIGLMYFIWR